MRTNNRVRLLILVLVIPILLSACGDETTYDPVPTPGIAVDISSDVTPGVEVKAGQQVTWTNRDDQRHVVRHVPDDEVVLFDSGELQPGDSYSFVFIEPGRYRYGISGAEGTEATVVVVP